MAIKVGSKVRDSITKLEGIVTTRSEHLYGCVHVWIQPAEVKDGKPADIQCFDEQRVELLEEPRKYVSPHAENQPGGPPINATRPRF